MAQATSAPYAAWREQLTPWLTVLREANIRITLPCLPTVSDIETLWIKVKAPQQDRNTSAEWSYLAEALELLELLARVDYRAAWYLLLETAGQPQCVEQFGELRDGGDGGDFGTTEDLLPKFVIQVLDEALLEPDQPTIFGLLRLIVKTSKAGSSTFEKVQKALLEKYAQSHGGQQLDREAHGRVKLSLELDVRMEFDNESAVRCVFTQLGDAVFAHKHPEAILPGMHPDDQDDDDDDDDGDDDDGDGDGDGVVDLTTAEAPRDSGDDATDCKEEDAESPLLSVVDLTHDDGASPKQTQKKRGGERGALTFESFRVHITSISAMTNLALYLIQQATKSGLLLSHFTVACVAYAQLHPSLTGDFAINQLVPWRGRLDGRGIRNLTIDMGAFDEPAVRGFCTAIASSNGLEAFAFEKDVGEVPLGGATVADREVWWRWLAYAVFSRVATHSIHSVALNMEQFDEVAFADDMREVLEQSDPLTFLYESERLAEMDPNGDDDTPATVATTTAPAMVAAFKKTASIRVGFHRDGAMHGLSIGEPNVTYQVVRNRPDEDFVEFVLPGTGVCWTDRSELLELRPAPRRESHGIRHLTLKYLEEHTVPPAAALLELIGGHIERLTILDLEGGASSELFAAVWRFCPNLKRLDITQAEVETLEWLYDHPAEPNAPRLETLSLDAVSVSDHMSWSSLFTALSDSHHHLTQSLRQLHVGMRVVRDQELQVLEDERPGLCLDMLDKNTRLLRCDLLPGSDAVVAKYEQRATRHRNGYIPEQDAPLGKPETLAFLGVTTPLQRLPTHKQPRNDPASHCGSGLVSARYKLNPEMLRLILDFAAIPKRRQCLLQQRRPEFVIPFDLIDRIIGANQVEGDGEDALVEALQLAAD